MYVLIPIFCNVLPSSTLNIRKVLRMFVYIFCYPMTGQEANEIIVYGAKP